MEAKVTRFREERDGFLVVSPLSLTPETVATIRAFGSRPAAGLAHATIADKREMIEILGITGVLRASDNRAPNVGRHRVSMEWEEVLLWLTVVHSIGTTSTVSGSKQWVAPSSSATIRRPVS